MLNKTDLANFYGTENYYKTMDRRFVCTEGVHHVREKGGKGGAYWLVDAITSHQNAVLRNKDTRLQDMQFWHLEVKDKTAVLTCVADTGETPAVRQVIEYTDFDFSIDLWVERADENRWVILLPSEH